MTLRRAIAAFTLAALLACAPAAAAARLFGFNDDWHAVKRAVAVTKRFHSNSERLQVFWRVAEPSPGAYDWYGWDVAYRAMVSRGVYPLLDVVSAPAWARDASCPDEIRCPQSPSHDGDFARFVEALVRRYPLAVGVEISNEPNLHNWWLRPDPARYAQMLKAGYLAVKQANPRMPVIIGGTCCTTAHSGGNIGAAAFLSDLYAYGVKGFYDAIGFHVYPGRAIALVARDIRFELRNMRRVRNAHGDGSPFWITEVGFPSTGVSRYGGGVFTERNQAVRETIAYRVLRSVRDVAAIYLYRLTDPAAGEIGGFGMGIFHRNLTPKPAARALLRAVRAGR